MQLDKVHMQEYDISNQSPFELSDENIEAQIEGIVCQFEALREENIMLLESIGEKDKIIEMHQEELDKFLR
ncbi:hypothetical protein FH972_002814 [Carpinus fangiana]|uniref:Uncharacterized protein n=1 Tax=Carpinus fangiana TaxID=176857 RepID=A0A5N6QG06_9ROSI|nr:hypothetical protein FH972_002814 [Carpinus fangiana]